MPAKKQDSRGLLLLKSAVDKYTKLVPLSKQEKAVLKAALKYARVGHVHELKGLMTLHADLESGPQRSQRNLKRRYGAL